MKLGERDIVGRFDPDGAPRLGEAAAARASTWRTPVCSIPSTQVAHSESLRLTFARYPSLAGRTVFVSGGASGIGADIVRAFAGNGARVAFVDLQREAGEALVREIIADTATTLCSSRATSPTSSPLRAAIAQTRAGLARSACSSTTPPTISATPSSEVSVEFWDRTQNVNLRHHFFAAQAVHPQMRELGSGSIINLSSIAWRVGAGGNAGLCCGEGRRRSG